MRLTKTNCDVMLSRNVNKEIPMALKGIKVPRKSKKQRVNRKTGFVDQDWTGWEKWDGKKFHTIKRAAIDQYYTLTKPADMHVHTHTWMSANGYDKYDIKCYKAAPSVSPYLAIYARLLLLGMPDFNQKEDDYWQTLAGTSGNIGATSVYLKTHIDKAISNGKGLVEEKEAKDKVEKERLGKLYKPSIQEVMRDTAFAMTEEIEELVDEWITNPDPAIVKKFDPVRIFRKVGTRPNHARIIKQEYEGPLSEMILLNNMPTSSQLKKMDERERDDWEQLEEGYSHYDKKQREAALLLFQKIQDACDIIIAEAKTTRKPRKVKEKSANEKVKKLQFKMSDSAYGIASEPPEKLIGAVACIVFNCKNRKLGIYVATDSDGFTVKGTSLQNYNEKTSLQKTMRKPQEQLSLFKKTTKIRAMKQFDSIKTTDTKLNGRFNSETVILAVYK